MTSFRQIEANRRNARSSTGPTTEQGKQRSRCNAVRHGLTAETVIGALEDAEELGLVAAWHHDFGPKEASILNRMVLLYAVPLALFAGTVTSSRAELSQDLPLVIALCVATVGFYGAIFLLSRSAFRMSMGVSALSALTASAPAVPFVGPAVLGDLLGRPTAAIPIAVGSLVINLTVVPVTILFSLVRYNRRIARKQLGTAGRGAFGIAPHVASRVSRGQDHGDSEGTNGVGSCFRFCYRAERLPHSSAHRPLTLHAGTRIRRCRHIRLRDRACIRQNIMFNWRVVFFVFLKNIVQPALVLGGLRWLGYGNPTVSGAVLTTAIPAMPIVVMLALQYRVVQAEAASAVFLSVIGSLITMGIFIVLTS